MIKITDLRIGNFYEWIPDDEEEKDLYRIDDAYSLYEKSNIVNEIIPVKLTPEWLKKFGFKEKERDHSIIYFIGINPVTHDYLFDISWIEGYSYPFYRNGYFEIKYVHQLQNLYFALTGEELEFNQH